MYSLSKKAIAEALGTFVLVFFACGTAAVTGANLVPTALAFGLVIVAMAYVIGDISGCHINPAVSLAMLISRKLSPKEFGIYAAAQFAGATVGAALLYGVLEMSGAAHAWATNSVIMSSPGGYIGSLILEIVLTFVFVYAILGVTSKTDNKSVTGIVIGLTLTLVHLIGTNLTGTSVNPARSFGTAIMTLLFNIGVEGGADAMAQVWVFLLAPLLGGALAAFVFGVLNKKAGKTDAIE